MIQSLQSLRGIFAMFIFLQHYWLWGNSPLMPNGGVCGLTFFIMLSGFVMSAGYGNKVCSPDFEFRQFLFKRLKRIYPMHLFAFIVWALLLSDLYFRGGQKQVLANLLLIQSWIPSVAYYFSCNGVSWCLSVLAFCYIMFPYIMRIINKLYPWKMVPIFMGIVTIYILGIHCISEENIAAYIYVFPVMRLLDFIIGMILWKIYKNIAETAQQLTLLSINTTQITTVILLAIAFFYASSIPVRILHASYWWLPISIIILIFALFDTKNTVVGKFLKLPLIKWFGKISFSFYLLHQIVIEYGIKYAVQQKITDYSFSIFISIFIVSIALAWVSYEYVEKNLTTLSLSRLKLRLG